MNTQKIDILHAIERLNEIGPQALQEDVKKVIISCMGHSQPKWAANKYFGTHIELEIIELTFVFNEAKKTWLMEFPVEN